MATATKSNVRQATNRVKRVWAEMDYAQRRLFEIRTGVAVIDRSQRTSPAASVDELEALYRLEDRTHDDRAKAA
jgi:BMFP domain-containing protein YqiC